MGAKKAGMVAGLVWDRQETILRRNGITATADPSLVENLLHVADFLLNFAGNLIRATLVLQIVITGDATSGFFGFALQISGGAFDFVLRAVFHIKPWLNFLG